MEHQLAADGQPEAADALRVDVRAALEEGDGGLDVLLALPAERVRVALALALAAAVEEEHAVAVAGEHARVRLGSVATGEGDHGGTVLGRDVPAGELEPVARGERDLLVVGAEVRLGHDRAPQVREEVSRAQGRDDEQGDGDACGAEQQRGAGSATAGCPRSAASSTA